MLDSIVYHLIDPLALSGLIIGLAVICYAVGLSCFSRDEK